MLWLHVHFPRLALEAQFIDDHRPLPQLLLKPGHQTIIQCNDLAISQGVRIGMNKKTAFCLLEDVALADYDPHIEQASLNQLALLCYHHSAQISLIPPQGLLLEMGSMLSFFGGLTNYWAHLKDRLTDSGFYFRMCTGHTPLAARTLAQAGIELRSEQPHCIEQALLQLTIHQLGLPDRFCQKLSAMGIHQYRQLKALPRKELGYRFGPDIIERLDRLEHDIQPPTRYQLPERFQQTIHLNYDAEHVRGLIFPLRRALLNLEAYLVSRQLVCEKLLIKLEHRDGRASLLTIPSVRGSYRQQDWLALLQVQLEHTPLIDPVVSLTLRAKGFIDQPEDHKDLVGGRHLQADADRMQSLLLARLGDDRVKTLRVEADPRPEVASQLQSSHQPSTELFLRQWPSLILPSPKAISINQYDILSGPERIEGGWWDAPSVRRDYYIARKQTQTVWVFRRDDGQWFLHGIFA